MSTTDRDAFHGGTRVIGPLPGRTIDALNENTKRHEPRRTPSLFVKTRNILKILAVTVALVCAAMGQAADMTWTSATSTAWNTGSNWQQGAVPAKGEDITTPTGATRQPGVPLARPEPLNVGLGMLGVALLIGGVCRTDKVRAFFGKPPLRSR